MKSNLQSQCKEFGIVINVPNSMGLDTFNSKLIQLNERLTQNSYLYAAMLHDKDTNDRGELKTLHVHYVIWSSKRCRIETMLYRIVDYLGLSYSEINCVQIDKCVNLPFAIQYLTHKNDQTKYQYNYHYIITNLNADALKELYDSEQSCDLTTAKLVEYIVKDRMTNIELMFKLGVSKYHYYKTDIMEIRQAYFCDNDRATRDMLRALEKKYNEDYISGEIE